MKLDVTVVIPTRNRPKATLRSVRSALAQSPPPQQVIVVDDASTDATADIVQREFGDSVELLRNAFRIGGNASRNIGGLRSRTRYVSFLDSDDEFLPGKLHRQITAMDVAKSDFSSTGFITETGKIYRLPVYAYRKLLTRNCLGGTSGLVVRKSLFERERFNERMFAVQDWEYYLRLAKFGAPTVIPDPLYIYGTSEDNRITSNARKRALGHFQLFSKHIKNNDKVDDRILRYHFWVLLSLRYTHKKRKKNFTFLNKIILKCLEYLT